MPLAALSPPLELREAMVTFTAPGARSLNVILLSLTITFLSSVFGWFSRNLKGRYYFPHKQLWLLAGEVRTNLSRIAEIHRLTRSIPALRNTLKLGRRRVGMELDLISMSLLKREDMVDAFPI